MSCCTYFWNARWYYGITVTVYLTPKLDYGDTNYGDTNYGDTNYGDTNYGDTNYGDTNYGDTSKNLSEPDPKVYQSSQCVTVHYLGVPPLATMPHLCHMSPKCQTEVMPCSYLTDNEANSNALISRDNF